MKLIDKDKVTKGIKRRISLFKKEMKTEKWSAGATQMNAITLFARIAMLEEILSFLDTLEVKGVDLEKELDKYTTNNYLALEGNSESPYLVEKDDMLKIAKHFYELGLKAQKGD